jgi:transposase
MKQDTQIDATMKSPFSHFIGIDLSSKLSTFCILDAGGEVLFRGQVPTNREDFTRRFAPFVPAVVAIETGSQARMADDVLSGLGHTVVTANPRRVAAISRNIKKSDEEDAQLLARLVRMDPKLLSPVAHRSAKAHEGLSLLRGRDLCVRSRTAHINLIRGMAKGFEVKLITCDAEDFAEKILPLVAGTQLGELLAPILMVLETLNKSIEEFDRKLTEFGEKYVPAAKSLQRIPGVGPITSLGFALAVDDPHRFPNQRAIGAYFGLVPRRDQSGDVDKRLGITKAGDALTRRLLTQSANRLMMTRAKDCDLKRFGERLMNSGQTNRKRAVSAVARKLACQMLRVLKTGVAYEPDFLLNLRIEQEASKAKS